MVIQVSIAILLWCKALQVDAGAFGSRTLSRMDTPNFLVPFVETNSHAQIPVSSNIQVFGPRRIRSDSGPRVFSAVLLHSSVSKGQLKPYPVTVPPRRDGIVEGNQSVGVTEDPQDPEPAKVEVKTKKVTAKKTEPVVLQKKATPVDDVLPNQTKPPMKYNPKPLPKPSGAVVVSKGEDTTYVTLSPTKKDQYKQPVEERKNTQRYVRQPSYADNSRVSAGPVKHMFDFAIKDNYSGNDYGHQESQEGQNTRGVYYVQLPDGRRQRVSYTVSGESGFMAKVTYEKGGYTIA